MEARVLWEGRQLAVFVHTLTLDTIVIEVSVLVYSDAVDVRDASLLVFDVVKVGSVSTSTLLVL